MGPYKIYYRSRSLAPSAAATDQVQPRYADRVWTNLTPFALNAVPDLVLLLVALDQHHSAAASSSSGRRIRSTCCCCIVDMLCGFTWMLA